VELRNGDYVDARFYQGLSEEQLGQRDAAIASFRATLELDRSGEWTTEANAALARLGTR
jgi:predicted TPR repeat methyltransferase